MALAALPFSNKTGCDNGYPLVLRTATSEELLAIQEERNRHSTANSETSESLNATAFEDCPFNPDSIRGVLKRIDWEALVPAAQSVGLSLPLTYNDNDLNDDMFLQAVHHVLNEVRSWKTGIDCRLILAFF